MKILKKWLLLREAQRIIKYHQCKSCNYYRETDFITNLSLKIKKQIWDEKHKS